LEIVWKLEIRIGKCGNVEMWKFLMSLNVLNGSGNEG